MLFLYVLYNVFCILYHVGYPMYHLQVVSYLFSVYCRRGKNERQNLCLMFGAFLQNFCWQHIPHIWKILPFFSGQNLLTLGPRAKSCTFCDYTSGILVYQIYTIYIDLCAMVYAFDLVKCIYSVLVLLFLFLYHTIQEFEMCLYHRNYWAKLFWIPHKELNRVMRRSSHQQSAFSYWVL